VAAVLTKAQRGRRCSRTHCCPLRPPRTSTAAISEAGSYRRHRDVPASVSPPRCRMKGVLRRRSGRTPTVNGGDRWRFGLEAASARDRTPRMPSLELANRRPDPDYRIHYRGRQQQATGVRVRRFRPARMGGLSGRNAAVLGRVIPRGAGPKTRRRYRRCPGPELRRGRHRASWSRSRTQGCWASSRRIRFHQRAGRGPELVSEEPRPVASRLRAAETEVDLMSRRTREGERLTASEPAVNGPVPTLSTPQAGAPPSGLDLSDLTENRADPLAAVADLFGTRRMAADWSSSAAPWRCTNCRVRIGRATRKGVRGFADWTAP